VQLVRRTRQFVIHQVAHRKKPDHMTLADYRKMPAMMSPHRLHCFFDAGQLVNSRNFRRHHLADAGLIRIAMLQHHTMHQVALAENSA